MLLGYYILLLGADEYATFAVSLDTIAVLFSRNPFPETDPKIKKFSFCA
jgi:hypothetical protein